MKPKGVQSGGHGLGHMSDVPVSAFDPIFRLHHWEVECLGWNSLITLPSNSDRLLAMCQCLNWKAWFDKVEDKKKGDPLLPFHRIETDIPATGYWTSDVVKDWTKLGYQYDDLISKPGAILPENVLDEKQFQIDLAAHIQDIYPRAKALRGDLRQ
ncbi:hypothetical protein FOCG_00118 [Fusarium oxysporum f. sp. radicis-lycopersici 26381]|uniref:Tyrosinase copper-binding domain-containing protein n=1 Tax=Fusarium oxysporum Fo47 TaxID=660027 RepID=W9KNC5_FUSOX|nr:hypothetical protein FOZG_04605 [Fusarium oxysporum Fo47]EXL60842.1 hypothetical protein FOCG_00118 [Fusarium oxysporum f. sp. radicis-lycopersici 26381]